MMPSYFFIMSEPKKNLYFSKFIECNFSHINISVSSLFLFIVKKMKRSTAELKVNNILDADQELEKLLPKMLTPTPKI